MYGVYLVLEQTSSKAYPNGVDIKHAGPIRLDLQPLVNMHADWFSPLETTMGHYIFDLRDESVGQIYARWGNNSTVLNRYAYWLWNSYDSRLTQAISDAATLIENEATRPQPESPANSEEKTNGNEPDNRSGSDNSSSDDSPAANAAGGERASVLEQPGQDEGSGQETAHQSDFEPGP